MPREAFFLDAPGGGRFCLVTRPEGTPVGSLLFVPPFAEELNKSRRMIALGARAFAEKGWTVLQMDLFGCGDSGGDFGDAGWQSWLDDVASGWAWLKADSSGPVVIWTLRAGSLLVADWLEQSGERAALLMWQPVTNGRQHLGQFLRLKAASEMLAEADAKAAMARIRADLLAGRRVEVAGYEINPALAGGLDAAVLRLGAAGPGPVALLEVSNAEPAAPSPSIRMLADKWVAAGAAVGVEVVPGAAFWQTQEIELAPALIDRSLAVLERCVR